MHRARQRHTYHCLTCDNQTLHHHRCGSTMTSALTVRQTVAYAQQPHSMGTGASSSPPGSPHCRQPAPIVPPLWHVPPHEMTVRLLLKARAPQPHSHSVRPPVCALAPGKFVEAPLMAAVGSPLPRCPLPVVTVAVGLLTLLLHQHVPHAVTWSRWPSAVVRRTVCPPYAVAVCQGWRQRPPPLYLVQQVCQASRASNDPPILNHPSRTQHAHMQQTRPPQPCCRPLTPPPGRLAKMNAKGNARQGETGEHGALTCPPP
jgi:hypothetical protein